jgi:O-antigen ligase
LPPIAVFVSTILLPDKKLKRMVYLFVGVAVVEALIGLAQFGTGTVTVFGDEPLYQRSAIGTYANRDHLAGLMEMALPFALAVLILTIRPRSRSPSVSSKRSPARTVLGESVMNRAALLASASVAILVALIFTRSRTGLALGMLSILLCAAVFSQRIGSRRSVRMFTIVGLSALAIAIEIGLTPILARFTDVSVAADMRWSIYSATSAGIGDFFPFGSGIGSYPDLFRRFQPSNVPGFVNHAHNDYLEWLFEGGLLAAVALLLVLIQYVRRWVALWRAGRVSGLA